MVQTPLWCCFKTDFLQIIAQKWPLTFAGHCVATGGETEEEMIRIDMLENHLMDFRIALARLCYDPDFVSVALSVFLQNGIRL